MKYIRTKDGIEKLDANREHLAKYMNGKLADTIEELCDEFVHGRMTFRTLKECLEYAPLGGEVYGAIWFKGEHNEPILKSIAKLNEKGELELL